MSLPSDLLALAQQLVALEPTRPKQSSLRRAISTAYYAVFHLLTNAATRLYVRENPELAGLVNRTFNHADMNRVSKEMARGQLPKALSPKGGGVRVIPTELKQVMDVFSNLQQERHAADYDTTRWFTRKEVSALVVEAEAAFENWDRINQTDEARLYLAGFLLWDTWNKPPR